VNVAAVFVLLNEVLPATEVPAGPVRVNVTEAGVTAWLNVALGAMLTATPVALDAGAVDVTAGAGGAAVVKLQEYGLAMVWPVEFVAPLTVAV
jgi:hypothetical protein